MEKIPMTLRGAERLRQELNHLKTVTRREVISAIAEARKHGDLKENAEYHAAKEKQGFVEGRILEIEGKLGRAQIIDVAKLPNNGQVVFGSTIQLANITTDEVVTYQIVGEDESNIKDGKISVRSPIARVIIGKRQGDMVELAAPSGVIEYEILKVEYL
jgi:transcription elongation factor GreA